MRTLLFICLLIGLKGLSQTVATPSTTEPFIEVNGMAEMEVTPNEIYIQFNLKEYEQDRVIQTILMQEQALTEALQKAGLDMQQINVSDFESNYVRVNWGKKDYRQEKKYDFKVATIQETAKVFEVFEALEVRNARISKVDHSDRRQFENDMRIAATQEAKNRANAMLTSIGNKAGKALYIKENAPSAAPIGGINLVYDAYEEMSTFKGGAIVQYQKMRIVCHVSARFAIE